MIYQPERRVHVDPSLNSQISETAVEVLSRSPKFCPPPHPSVNGNVFRDVDVATKRFAFGR